MKRTLIAAACLTLVSLGACGGGAPDTEAKTETPSESQSSAAAGFEIEYEKFTLDNGLDVILHVDRSDPIVAFTTVVHAGSNREKPGRTGFAHFFEHMAFNDSENVPRGWNRKAIPDWGGQRNGGTWSDGTIYFEVVPKDAFDKILWIDSDRLGYMVNTVTVAALEREKQVVKNEKRQRVDNAPYGYTQEVIRTALYPEGHPYSWTVIGSLPDLQAATLGDLREFYDQYYGAANATLVIAGDIDLAETREKVERWFGEIRRGPDVEPLPPMPVSLAQSKSLWFEDNFATLPELRITLPSVEQYHEDEAALTVLAQLLAGSKASPVHRSVVFTNKLAPNVAAFNNAQELAGEFVFFARANAGTDLDDVYNALDEGLTLFEEEGVNAQDLQRIKAEQETGLYAGVSTVLGKSNQLARDNEFAGDPVRSVKYVEQLRAVSAEDVMRVYEAYIKDKPSIMTSFVPKGQSDLALEGAELATVWLEEVVAGVANEEVSQGEEAEYEKTASKYDRSEPPFGDLPLIQMPDVWQASLANDVQVLGIENSETPLVTFDIVINGGAWLDEAGKTGTSSLLARLMNEGTANRTSVELEQAIGLLGSGVTVFSTSDEVRLIVTSLARNLDETIAIAAEVLSAPRWQEADFDRVKRAALTAIKGREANPNAIAALAFNRLVYGDEHVLGTPTNGTVETVSAIELADLQAYYEKMLMAGARIHIAGDISPADAEAALAPLAAVMGAPELTLPEFSVPAQEIAGKTYFIDVPGSKQSVLYIGKLALASTDADAKRLDFANEKLGGGISGDLSQVLRIEKGYTYGAFSGIANGLTPQPFRITTSVRANATQASLETIKEMVTDYGPGFTDAFVDLTRQKLLKQNTRAFESLGAKLGILRTISKYGKSLTYVEDEQNELVNMTLADYREVIGEYLNEDEMTYLIIGDAETQLEPVRAFAGGEVTMLDIYGAPIR